MIRTATVLGLTSMAFLASCARNEPAAPPTGQPSVAGETEPTSKPLHASRRADISSIRLEEFFALHEAGMVMVFDARPAVFHAMGHIPGAISLPKDGCDKAILARNDEINAALAAGKTLVVYCTGLLCPDARAVAMRLAAYGHPARIFSGGLDAWRDAGMPTE